jgi:hypothetical protein
MVARLNLQVHFGLFSPASILVYVSKGLKDSLLLRLHPLTSGYKIIGGHKNLENTLTCVPWSVFGVWHLRRGRCQSRKISNR